MKVTVASLETFRRAAVLALSLCWMSALTHEGRAQIISLDFGGGPGPSQKVGLAATGQNANDFWNYFNQSYGIGSGSLANLKLVGGTVTSVGVTVDNAPGGWGNGSSDPMYNDFIYPFDGGNITVTLTDLSVGSHDLYLYCSDGNYQVSASGVDYGSQTARENQVVNPPVWQEGVQYALFHSVQVASPGDPVVVTVLPGVDGLPVISGLQIAPGTSPSCTPPPSDLISWWRSENDANDSIGGNNGVALNGAGYAGGKVGQGFEFDGVDDCVDIPYSPTLISPAFTVETWLKPLSQVDEGINQESIFEQSYGELQLCVRGGTTGLWISFLISDDSWAGYSEVVSSHEIPIGQFTHVAGTWDGYTLRLYVNGVLDAESTTGTTPIASQCDFYIGGIYHNNGDSCDYVGQFFHGIVDELSFYSRALTTEEIQAIRAAGSSGKCVPTPPIIVTHPQSQTATVGTAAAFSVVAQGPSPLCYQWQRNGIDIPGETSSTYTIANATFSDEAVYTVVVNNPAGTALGGPATLMVVNSKKPVAFSQNRSVVAGSSVNLRLKGSDPYGHSLTYVVPGWLNPPQAYATPKGTLTGTPPNLVYTPNVGASGDDSFTFKVNNGLMDSDLATVLIHIVADAGDMNTGGDASNTLNPGPTATPLPAVCSGTGHIGGVGDPIDHYRVPVSAQSFVHISLGGATMPIVLTIFGTDSVEQGSVTVDASQTVNVPAFADSAGYVYIRLTPVDPSVTGYNLSVEVDPTDPTTVWPVIYGADIIDPPVPVTEPPDWGDFFEPDGRLKPDVIVIGGPQGGGLDANPQPGTLTRTFTPVPDPGGGCHWEISTWSGDVVSGNADYGTDQAGSEVAVNGNRNSAHGKMDGKLEDVKGGIEVEATYDEDGGHLAITLHRGGAGDISFEVIGDGQTYPFNISVEKKFPFTVFMIPFVAKIEGSCGVAFMGYGIAAPVECSDSPATELGVRVGASLSCTASLAVGIDLGKVTVKAGLEAELELLNAEFTYHVVHYPPCVTASTTPYPDHSPEADGEFCIGYLHAKLVAFVQVKLPKFLNWIVRDAKLKYVLMEYEPGEPHCWPLVNPGSDTFSRPPGPGGTAVCL